METTLSGIQFSITRGNITEEDTDAIAIPVGTDLLPEGPSAGAVFGAADDQLPKQINSEEPVDEKSVTTTEASGLPSKELFLSILETKGNVENRFEYLKECYNNILTKASTNDQIQTLSIMPLGLGDHNFRIDTVARSGIRAVMDSAHSLSLSSVKLVVYDAIQYSSFIRFGKEELNK